MENEDSDNYDFSDVKVDDKNHERLLQNVLSLNKIQTLKKPSRTEPTLNVSEFNLVKTLTGNKGSVHVNELAKVLTSRKKLADIEKKVKKTGKVKILPKPLEKPQSDRIRRSIAYEKSRLEFDRWEATVASNRAATHLAFPLVKATKLKIFDKKPADLISHWRVKSDIEKQIESLEPKVVEEYHVENDEKEQFVATAEEMIENRKEAAKLRAVQSYKEAKARRQKKIKSKKYHRIQRREKIKQQLKDFELLQKTNPEEALKKLDEIERTRAMERFSLRHRGTGQWAKNKQIRAKYDKESREVLAQQLAVSRDLTQKLQNNNSDSEDEGFQETSPVNSNENNGDNPWVINGVKPEKEVADFVSGYRKFWTDKNKQTGEEDQEQLQVESPSVKDLPKCIKTAKSKKVTKSKPVQSLKSEKKQAVKLASDDAKKCNKKKSKKNQLLSGTSEWKVSAVQDEDVDDLFNELEDNLKRRAQKKLHNVQTKAIPKATKKTRKSTNEKQKTKKKIDLSLPSKKVKIDEELIEQPHSTISTSSLIKQTDLLDLKNILNTSEATKTTSKLNSNKLRQSKTPTSLSTAIPDIISTPVDDEPLDNENQDQNIMAILEDDEIVDDFSKEKVNEIQKDTPKDIDLSMPGWGSWTGADIKPNTRKTRRFIVKMPKNIPRRDDNKGTLIINENAQNQIRSHMVTEIPFPFKTVKDFEANLRAPIGNTFVPETSFHRLIAPEITTKIGQIIEPISRNTLVCRKK